MPGRVAARLIATAFLVVALPGCKSEREELLEVQVAELREKVAQFESQLEDVRTSLEELDSALDELRSGVDHLQSSLGDFGTVPWRQVAEEVESAAGDIESATSSATTALEEAQRAAN